MNNKIEVTNLPVVGKIIIKTALKNKIDYLHRKVGALEWSGILLYKLVSGTITTINNLVFEAVDVYPMDIGSAANTTFKYTPDEVVNMYDVIEEAIELSMGLCHSHNSMKSFISGTDFNELIDNSANYNYYISLVVSFDQQYVCKIAFPSKTTVTKQSVIRNEDGKFVTVSQIMEEESLLLGDLTIEIENDTLLEDWFITQVDAIKKQKAATSKATTYDKWSKGSNLPLTGTTKASSANSVSNVRPYEYSRDAYESDHNNWNDYPVATNKDSFGSLFNQVTPKITTDETPLMNKLELFLSGILGYDIYMEDSEQFYTFEEIMKETGQWIKADFEMFEEWALDNIVGAYEHIYQKAIDYTDILRKIGEATTLLQKQKPMTKTIKRLIAIIIKEIPNVKQYYIQQQV